MRTEVFQQIGVDSGALGLLSSSVHRFDRPGTFAGTAYVDGVARGEYDLVVEEGGPAAAQIDLSAFGARRARRGDGCCDDGPDRPTYHVAVGGYVCFCVTSGAERWATVVGDPRERAAEFDSRRLEAGDMFAASVLRPGRYSVRNSFGKGRTELVVPPVRRGKEPYRPAEPVRTRMGEVAGRKSLRLGQAQGVVFTVAGPTRIVIDLDEAIH